MTFPEVLKPDPESKCLFQEDFHCNVALRNYERAWCAGRAEEPINLFLSFSMLWCFSNCEVSVGVGGLLSLKEPISMKWIITWEFAYQTKPPTSTTWLHQHPYLISSRSLAKKKFCCKTKGVACKASWKYWSLMFFFLNLGGGFKYFLFSPLFWEMIPIDEHIFQMGWNHQLVICVLHPKNHQVLLWYFSSQGLEDEIFFTTKAPQVDPGKPTKCRSWVLL